MQHRPDPHAPTAARSADCPVPATLAPRSSATGFPGRPRLPVRRYGSHALVVAPPPHANIRWHWDRAGRADRTDPAGHG